MMPSNCHPCSTRIPRLCICSNGEFHPIECDYWFIPIIFCQSSIHFPDLKEPSRCNTPITFRIFRSLSMVALDTFNNFINFIRVIYLLHVADCGNASKIGFVIFHSLRGKSQGRTYKTELKGLEYYKCTIKNVENNCFLRFP